MNRCFAGLLLFIIFCTGFIPGCDKESAKIASSKNQVNNTDQTEEAVKPYNTVPRGSVRKFGPFDIDHKRIMVTYYYEDASFEIKDETGASYLKETHNSFDSSFTVEDAFKLEGKSGEGLILFYDFEPNAPPCGPEFQIFGLGSGSLEALSPSIIVCGQIEKLPEGTPRGVLKLLDGDLIKVEVWKDFFGIRIPFKVDFQKKTIAPLMTQGVFDINIPDPTGQADTSEGKKITLYSDHNGTSKSETIMASAINKVEFIGSYADVQLEKVSKSQLDIKITNVWLKVKVNGRDGWTNNMNDYVMLGLRPLG